MKYSPAVAALLAAGTTSALTTKDQQPSKSLSSQFKHAPITTSLLANAKQAAKAQAAKKLSQKHEQKPLPQAAHGSREMVQVINQPPQANGPFNRLPANADMGDNPQYMIVHRPDSIPDGWYVPDMTFVQKYYQQLMDGTADIGPWAKVAFNGGQYVGKGYQDGGEDAVQCNEPCVANPMYDVLENPYINDILMVKAAMGKPDPGSPDKPAPGAAPGAPMMECPKGIEEPHCDGPEFEGYNCECTRLPSIDPFTHKPIWPDYPEYTFLHRDVYGFNGLATSLGYDEQAGWNTIPNGYFGYWLNLDQPGLWCYHDWEEYRFGITLRDEQTGGYVIWTPIGGVNELTDDGGYFYRYIFHIPDEGVNVGDKYTPVIYDGTVHGGTFVQGMVEQYDEYTITIGAPYMAMDEWDYESSWFAFLFKMVDMDGNGCLTKNEMWEYVQWGNTDSGTFESMAAEVFNSCDSNGSGVLTWAELNDCLPADMDGSEADLLKLMFQYSDLKGDQSYTLTPDEVMAGVQEGASYTHKMYDHFDFYWAQFDMDGDTCVVLPEWEEVIKKTYTIETITTYWINYYWTIFQITEYWWWRYKTADGGFDWEGFRRRVPDGPAFDGADFLIQTGDGNLQQAWMWFTDDQCYFSLGYFDNWDAGSSGECSIPGHKTIGYDQNVTDIQWEFYNSPEVTHHFLYQLGDWGPTGQQTDERYYDGTWNMWLWQEPEEYCDPCYADAGLGYPDASYWGDGADYLADYYYGPTYDWASAMTTSQQMSMSSAMSSTTTTTTTVTMLECSNDDYIDDWGDGCDFYTADPTQCSTDPGNSESGLTAYDCCDACQS